MSREPWRPCRSTGRDWGRATAPWPRTSEGSRLLRDKLMSNRQALAEGSTVVAEAADAAKVGTAELQVAELALAEVRLGQLGLGETAAGAGDGGPASNAPRAATACLASATCKH